MNKYIYMYNYSFKPTYMDLSEKLQDEQYKNDLLTAFSLQSYNNKIIMKEIYDLLNKFEAHKQIIVLLNEISINTQTPFQINKKMAFIILFSFKNFYYFHTCLGYLLEGKPIDEDYFNKFIALIQKK